VQAACSADPIPRRGPADLDGGFGAPALERAAPGISNGLFANEADLGRWKEQWAEVQQILREAGRDVSGFVAAIYVDLAIDENASRCWATDRRVSRKILRATGRRDAPEAGRLWRPGCPRS